MLGSIDVVRHFAQLVTYAHARQSGNYSGHEDSLIIVV